MFSFIQGFQIASCTLEQTGRQHEHMMQGSKQHEPQQAVPKATQSTSKPKETQRYLEERRNKDAFQKRITYKDGNLEDGR